MADTDNLPGYGRPSVSHVEQGECLFTNVEANKLMTRRVEFQRVFASNPVAVACAESNAVTAVDVCVANVDKNGFTINLYRTSNVDTNVMWIAVGA